MVPRLSAAALAVRSCTARAGVGGYLSANLCAGATGVREREEFSTFGAIDGPGRFGEAWPIGAEADGRLA
jgi:hypothetical protein